MLRKLFIAALVVFGAGQAWTSWRTRPLQRAPGVIAAAAPLQEDPGDTRPIVLGDATLTPLARFSFKARVLAVSRYRWDAESAIAPYDIGIGWGGMSDTAVIERLDLKQSTRFLFWRWQDTPPLPEHEITRSAANIHAIPADSVVERRIAALRPGQIVQARGVLVEAARPDGMRWRSSLSRDDSGNGACELMYIESISAAE
jgi:hypothetical protein